MGNKRFRVVGRARRLFKPEVGCNLPDRPEIVAHTTDQRESRCSGSCLALGDDLFDETPVLGGITIIQRRTFVDLTCG